MVEIMGLATMVALIESLDRRWPGRSTRSARGFTRHRGEVPLPPPQLVTAAGGRQPESEPLPVARCCRAG